MGIKTVQAYDLIFLRFSFVCRGVCVFFAGIVWSLLVGDFCHNLVDGMVIAVAFKACNPTFALSVSAGVATHEVSSEIADFGVFVTDGRLTVSQALVLNFICSLSTILGGIIVLAHEDDISDEAQGLLLAFSAVRYQLKCRQTRLRRTKLIKCIYGCMLFCRECTFSLAQQNAGGIGQSSRRRTALARSSPPTARRCSNAQLRTL